MPRRSDGEGSIYQRSDGRWVGSLRVGSIRRSVYGKSRKEAADKLHVLKNESIVGQLTPPTKLSTEQYLKDWLDRATSNLRASTVHLYRTLIRVHINPAIGHVKLKDLAPIHLAEVYRRIRAKGRRARTTEQVHRLIHKALGDAVKLRIIPANPATALDVPAAHPSERSLWNHEQVAAFVAACSEYATFYDPLWLFLLGSGCRIGEALALHEDGISWGESTVSIKRAMSHVGNIPYEESPKTRAGVRCIALPQFALAALEHRRQFAVDGYLFRNQVGQVPTASDLRKRFIEACKRSGIEGATIHDLRRMHATLAVAAGVDVKTVQRRLGHATLAMTLGIYAQAMAGGDSKAAAALNRLMADCRETTDSSNTATASE